MAAVVKAAFIPCDTENMADHILNQVQDPFPFTHIYFYFNLLNNGYEENNIPATFKPWLEIMRERYPDLKFLFSIGGDSSIFAEKARNEESRNEFIAWTITLAEEYNFDGLDLRWSYPVDIHEMANLGSLLNEWRTAVRDESQKTVKAQLLLTATVFYSPEYQAAVNYPIQAIFNSLNWINVMAFDMYTPASKPELTGPPAPLYNPKDGKLSGDNGVRAWIKAGVPPKKLVFGLPFHGHGWGLENANNHEIFSPANGAAPNIVHPIPYRQIAPMLVDGAVYNPSYVTDYLIHAGTNWIGYDGKDSIFTKARYAKKKGLLGYFAWSLDEDTDDWTLSKEASEAWDRFAPTTDSADTGGAGTGGAGTGGALTFGNVTVTGGAGSGSTVTVTVTVDNVKVSNITGGTGSGGTGSGSPGMGIIDTDSA